MVEEAAYLPSARRLRDRARDKTKSLRTCFKDPFPSTPLNTHKYINNKLKKHFKKKTKQN